MLHMQDNQMFAICYASTRLLILCVHHAQLKLSHTIIYHRARTMRHVRSTNRAAVQLPGWAQKFRTKLSFNF